MALRAKAILVLALLAFLCGRSFAASRVIGRVEDEDRAPFEGLTISAIGTVNGETVFEQTLTDSQGAFAFDLPDGDWTIVVASQEALRARYLFIVGEFVRLSGETREITFVARERRERLFGYVRDEAGAGVAGIQIAVQRSADYFQVETDASGFYEVRLGPGDWMLSFDPANLRERGALRSYLPEPPVTIREGVDLEANFRVRAARSAIVATLQDEGGGAVADGQLVASLETEGEFIEVRGFFVEGRCVLAVCEGNWILSASAAGVFDRIPAKRVRVMGATQSVAFVASRVLAEVRGQVIGENGAPLANVEVGIQGGRDFWSLRTVTGQNGEFAFFVRPGPAVIWTSAPNYLLPRTEIFARAGSIVERTLRPRAVSSLATIQPHFPSEELATQVVAVARLNTGRELFEVAGDRLWLFPGQWTLSFATGSGLFQPIPDRVIAVGEASQTVDVDLQLENRNARIRGRIVDQANIGRPAIPANFHKDGAYGAAFATVETDGEGYFSAELPPGDWRVFAGRNGTLQRPQPHAKSPIARLAKGETRELGDILLPEPSATLLVRLLDELGQPIDADNHYLPSGPGLSLFHPTARIFSGSWSDSNEFRIGAIPGEWVLEMDAMVLNDAGHAAVEPKTITVRPGETSTAMTLKPLPSVIPPPRLSAHSTPTGETILSVYSELVMPVEIHASDDLEHWRLIEIRASNSEIVIQTSGESRFYRVRRLD